MNKCYINGYGCVAAQQLKKDSFLKEVISYKDAITIDVIKPNYRNFINGASIRRMSSAVKNGIVASSLAMKEINPKSIEAIIVGTGLGCLQDTAKFLERMLTMDEEFLTPTSFIQSTHNTVAGQIALHFDIKAYNFTYVDSASSFSSALMDGLMHIQLATKKKVLVGGVDEKAEGYLKLYRALGHYKSDREDQSNGVIAGEGAAFFVLENNQSETTYAELVAVFTKKSVAIDKIDKVISNFLKENKLSHDDIDVVLMGNNGDEKYDLYYENAAQALPSSKQLYFKHLTGEFLTSASIGTAIASGILYHQNIPNALFAHPESTSHNGIKNVLIYNQYRGLNHSLILLRNV